MTSDEEIKYINDIEDLRREIRCLKKIIDSNVVVITQLRLRVSQLKDEIFYMSNPDEVKHEIKEVSDFNPDLSEVSYT